MTQTNFTVYTFEHPPFLHEVPILISSLSSSTTKKKTKIETLKYKFTVVLFLKSKLFYNTSI